MNVMNDGVDGSGWPLLSNPRTLSSSERCRPKGTKRPTSRALPRVKVPQHSRVQRFRLQALSTAM